MQAARIKHPHGAVIGKAVSPDGPAFGMTETNCSSMEIQIAVLDIGGETSHRKEEKMEDVMTEAGVTKERISGTWREARRGNGRLIAAASWLLGVVILLESDPVWAQITKVNTVMQNVQTVLTSVAVTLFTVAIMWAGFKMAFSHAQWSDVSNVVIGGILVGGAAGIAAWLIN